MKRWHADLILLTVAIIWGSAFAVQRVAGQWMDPLTFWRDTVQKAPNKARPHNNLGEQYSKLGRLDDAIAEYKKALAKLEKIFVGKDGMLELKACRSDSKIIYG